MPRSPARSAASATVPILRVTAQGTTAAADALAVEEPLEIQLSYTRRGTRVHKSISVTMRTPGHDTELAAGFLFTEQIIASPTQIAEITTPCTADGSALVNTLRVSLHDGVSVDLKRIERHFYAASSCGVCGKRSIAALALDRCPPLDPDAPVLDATLVPTLPDALRRAQTVFAATGGLHAAGLFGTTGQLLLSREDVGRHNAVDKVIGHAFLARRTPLSSHALVVSGRASFELVQKTAAAGIPVLAAVGAPSTLAVDLARECGLTLLGFVREARFNVYTGAQRLRGLHPAQVKASAA